MPPHFPSQDGKMPWGVGAWDNDVYVQFRRTRD
jgi:hypothetical protein